jgi:hypothetical protein
MNILFNPHDWLGQRPRFCLFLIAVLIVIGGSI